MKKLWLPVIIVVIWLLAFVVGPWYAGQKVEAKLDTLLSSLNTNGVFKLEKKTYNKGLFSSETTVSISMDLNSYSQALSQVGGNINNPDPVILKGDVKHGPFMFDDGFSFAIGSIRFVPEVADENKQEISKIFGTDEPLTLSMQFNWDDSVTAGGNLIGFTMADEGVTSQQAKFTMDLIDGGKHLIGDFNWGGMTVAKPAEAGKNVKIGTIIFTIDQVLAMEDMWIGTSHFNIANIEFSDMGMAGKADKFVMVGQSSLSDNNEFMSGSVETTLKKVSVSGTDYVEDLIFKVSFNNLHAQSLQKLSKAVTEAQQAGGSAEAMQMAMGMQLMGILPEMVKKGLSISIDALDAKVMGEQVTSSLKIEVAEGTDVAQGMAAIAGVSATADVSVPRALLEQFPMLVNPEMLQGLIQQGLLFEEDGFIKSHAEFNAGQLSVNGTVMPIPGLSM